MLRRFSAEFNRTVAFPPELFNKEVSNSDLDVKGIWLLREKWRGEVILGNFFRNILEYGAIRFWVAINYIETFASRRNLIQLGETCVILST